MTAISTATDSPHPRPVIYNIIQSLMRYQPDPAVNQNWLEAYGIGFLRVFSYTHFRAVVAIILSFGIVILMGQRTIRLLLRMKVGDNPEFYHADLNQLMKDKANTPTMGGIIIVIAILASMLLLADLGNFYVHMAFLCIVWLACVGGADDYLKLTSARRSPGSREGLYTWEKLAFQLGLALLLGMFMYKHALNNPDQMGYVLNLPFMKTWEMEQGTEQFVRAKTIILLGRWTYVLIAVFVIAGTSNAVNLTDGMDGLASGVMGICAFAFMLLAMIAGNDGTAQQLLIPYIPRSDELSIVAGAMVGACLGFLWFNCSPAQVFMGDTGSLPLGGLLGYIAVVVRQEFLLMIIGGVFVMEAASVILQVGYFKSTGGKRVFRCAPIHHHFHLGGWTEQQVVVRFWLLSAVFAAIALATIKIR